MQQQADDVVVCVLAPDVEGTVEGPAAVQLPADPPYLFFQVPAGEVDTEIRAIVDAVKPVRVCVSPAVPPGQVDGAVRLARRLHDLAAVGLVPDDDVLQCTDHEVMLWLHATPILRQRLSARLLAPLAAQTYFRRAALGRTLLTWLEQRGSATSLAAALGVHPQTVRYRQRQLREMFDLDLDDPETAFALVLTLKTTLPLWTHIRARRVDI